MKKQRKGKKPAAPREVPAAAPKEAPAPVVEEKLIVLDGKSKSRDDGKTYYPSLTARLFANTIDLMMGTFIILPILPYISAPGENEAAYQLLTRWNNHELTEEQFRQEFVNLVVSQEVFTQVAVSFIGEFVLMGVLVLSFWFIKAATPGKMLLGMRIVDAETKEKPTRTQLLIRYFGYIVAGVPFGLGFLWILFNKKRQGWHDLMAGTTVIYRKKPRLSV